MSRRVGVFGLLAIAVMVAAVMVLLSGRLSERTATAPPGEISYVPCSSCDARHQRLQQERSGKD